MSITDKRVTSMKEIIDSMRLIKMYAWEESFLSRILDIRSKEIKELFKPSMLMSCTLTVSPSISILAGFGTIMVMTLSGVELSTTQAFTVMSVFSALQVCLELAKCLHRMVSCFSFPFLPYPGLLDRWQRLMLVLEDSNSFLVWKTFSIKYLS